MKGVLDGNLFFVYNKINNLHTGIPVKKKGEMLQ